MVSINFDASGPRKPLARRFLWLASRGTHPRRLHLPTACRLQDPDNDVTRNSFNIMRVKTAFEFAYQVGGIAMRSGGNGNWYGGRC